MQIMKKAIYSIVFLSLVLTGLVQAQSGYTAIQYVMSFGSGDIGEYISKPSFRGAVFEYQRSINENVSAGIELGWNVFYEKKDYDTYSFETASLSGVQYRYSNNFPMLVTVEYNLKPDNMLKPYANLGIGTMYTRRNTDMGIWTLEEKAWHFALKPEIGVLLEVSPGAAFKIAAKYYVGFKSGDLETQSYFGITGGFAFLF